MAGFTATGSKVRYTFGEKDRIENLQQCPAESATYRAVLMDPGRFGEKDFVAIKIFRIDSSTREAAQLTDPDLLMRWKEVKKLQHDNVIAYHKFSMHPTQLMPAGAESGRRIIELVFIMDCCNGSDLRTTMIRMRSTGRTLHVKTLFDFCKQMANGLAYLHSKNIIHGDLKPDSVLVNRSSTNQFRLRLCGLDSFTPSYATFVHPRHVAMCASWVAPEVQVVFREAACAILDDPIYAVLHEMGKQFAAMNMTLQEPTGAYRFMEQIIQTYGGLLWHSKEPDAREFFLKNLRRYLADHFHPEWTSEGAHSHQIKLFHDILQVMCEMDFARAREFCASLQADITGFFQKSPAETLDSVMSMYFKHIQTPPVADSLSPNVVFRMRNLTVRVDGRKADIWSIGHIMEFLEFIAFYTSEKWFDSYKAPFGLYTPKDDEVVFYQANVVPRDFKQIRESCMHTLADKRITARELINKLVDLEEHTYGSTWINNLQDGLTEKEACNSHRQMLQEIGCTCTYDYSFWQDCIGQGAYGFVYKARVTRAGTYKGNATVAIKEITLNHCKIKQMYQDQSWERAKEQWGQLVDFKHPHLVTYHKVSLWKLTKGAAIEFMMDYCTGGDLDSLITQCNTGVSTLPAEAVLIYARQLASGLFFLHKQNFVHGDLKPGNVLMNKATDDSGCFTLRIGDIDGAMRIHDNVLKSERKDLAGTGPYMSPEMVKLTFAQEHGDVGFATDIWSLGCVILELANCSVQIKERLFYKMIANTEGVLEIHKIERQSFSADQFLFQLSQGYQPFVSDLIHSQIRVIIKRCLVPDCKDRATAALIMGQLHGRNGSGTIGVRSKRRSIATRMRCKWRSIANRMRCSSDR